MQMLSSWAEVIRSLLKVARAPNYDPFGTSETPKLGLFKIATIKFNSMANDLSKSGISGPECWLRTTGGLHLVEGVCLVWLDELLYAVENRSLHAAKRGWKRAQRKHHWQQMLELMP